MSQKQVITLAVEANPELSLEELCSVCGVDLEFIHEMMAHGVIEPVQGVSVQTWRFDSGNIRVIRTAVHLHQDLEVNHAGIALAIELMDELQALRNELAMWKK